MTSEKLIGGAIAGAIGLTVMKAVVKKSNVRYIGFGKSQGVIPTIKRARKFKRRI